MTIAINHDNSNTVSCDELSEFISGLLCIMFPIGICVVTVFLVMLRGAGPAFLGKLTLYIISLI